MTSSRAAAESAADARGDGVIATSSPQLSAWQRRESPPVEQVRPGVWAIPTPVRVPVRFTYAYLIDNGRGTVLIDPGEGSDAAVEALRRGFTAIGFDLSRLDGIVVTHFHFDHWEGADRLAAETGAWVALGHTEWRWIEGLTPRAVSADAMIAVFESWGAPPLDAHELALTCDYGDTLAYRKPAVLPLHGELLPIAGEELEVILTPGHSPGHICLYDRRRDILFSGDHLLPGITPHIALNPFGQSDPVGQYLDALDLLARHRQAEVLPSHEYRFTGVHARIRELRDDIAARSAEVRVVLGDLPRASVWQVAKRLTWSRAWHEFSPLSRRMALGEAAAHVAHVSRRGAPENSR